MARVTVEDCIEKVDNRFELVLLAAHRSRMISNGDQLLIERDNDKNPVVALREIADGVIDHEDLKESLVESLQKHAEVDEPEAREAPQITFTTESKDSEIEVEEKITVTEEDYLNRMKELRPPEQANIS